MLNLKLSLFQVAVELEIIFNVILALQKHINIFSIDHDSSYHCNQIKNTSLCLLFLFLFPCVPVDTGTNCDLDFQGQ